MHLSVVRSDIRIMDQEYSDKVFSSKITRGLCGEQNNLYELLTTDAAKPVKLNEIPKSCAFQPKCDKYYEYKKTSKLKVKTVRDIRNLFEKDIDEYLPLTLEKQQNLLLKRIRHGFSKDEDTIKLAQNILKSDNPILRTSWQMLVNINPENHAHCAQYILWNGNNIRICGSKGGPNKFILTYERHSGKDYINNKKSTKPFINKKKCLLQNSLSLKTKPGPLRQKKNIDDSYQKHHIGNLELINLPKPGLDVMPVYGSPMEPTIRNFLHNLRDVDGIISYKWAEFAVSMVGTLKNSKAVNVQPNSCTTFDLSYNYSQNKMLMRRDIEKITHNYNDKNETRHVPLVKENEILEEVGKVLCQLIDSVEISLNQDQLFLIDDDGRNNDDDEIFTNINRVHNNTRDKNKNKYGELGRLDVTVIRLPENAQSTENKSKVCSNAYCALGCVCDSLNCAVFVKDHCGRLECMFKCKCDFSRYKSLDNDVSTDLIPGLLELDKRMNPNLSKEEQKFHQTVVLSGEKSILLKSRKRNWKASTKYSEFYKTMNLKNSNRVDRDLIVVVTKINCENIEPWCMVHNLYKCFCKGKFIHKTGEIENKYFEAPVSTVSECENIINSISNEKSHQSYMRTRPQRDKQLYIPDRNERQKSNSSETNLSLTTGCEKSVTSGSDIKTNKSTAKTFKQPEKSSYQSKSKENRLSDNLLSEMFSIPIDLESTMSTGSYEHSTCARTQTYTGRKYTKRYYTQMNSKIREMEKDDQTLHKRLKCLVNLETINSAIASESKDKSLLGKKPYPNKSNESDEDDVIPHKVMKKSTVSTVSGNHKENFRENTPELNTDNNIRINILSANENSNKSKLVAWLEHSYKRYKKRYDLGVTKLTLQAPQPKKMTLLPWNFILDRYKERKNLFLVTKQKPFRMFMAVNREHPVLRDCINIDDIRFADLYSYPITVKKLVTNATDDKDSFCILCGHSYCWELIGSVTKVDDPSNKDTLCDESNNGKSLDYLYNENSRSESDPAISTDDEDSLDTNQSETYSQSKTQNNPTTTESSKWFVMLIENDFSEIQFYNRGFFVKYFSIIKAINIARFSKKTVRLSSQKCAEGKTNSQFGIYAIPNANEDCVFIGPYECHESLGIETIRALTYTSGRRTRGYWITTNKIDNVNVIDNPMSFMPTKGIKPSQILCLSSKPNENKDSFSCVDKEPTVSESISPSKDKPKLAKPIKISKKNGFYSLSSNSLLRLPNLQKEQERNQAKASIETASRSNPVSTVTSVSISDLLSKLHTTTETKDESVTSNTNKLPNTTFDQDSKNDVNVVVDKYENCSLEESMSAMLKPDNMESKSTSDQPCISSELENEHSEKPKGNGRPEGTMFAILKPEEINKRIMNTNIISTEHEKANNEDVDDQINYSHQEMERDIEHFLDNSLPCFKDSDQNVFVISDDEDESTDRETISSVWIECKNIKNLGWISGLRNNKNNSLSFRFPGFRYSKYYEEQLAFKKINEILSRKICVYSKMKIEWGLATKESDLKAKKKLESSDLGSHLILTKYGPRLKHNVLKSISVFKRTSLSETKSTSEPETFGVEDEDLIETLE